MARKECRRFARLVVTGCADAGVEGVRVVLRGATKDLLLDNRRYAVDGIDPNGVRCLAIVLVVRDLVAISM